MSACVCFNDNVSWDESGESSWFHAHNMGEFGGEVLPFGCAVWFLPSTTKHRKKGDVPLRPKWGGRAELGVFAGYDLL